LIKVQCKNIGLPISIGTCCLELLTLPIHRDRRSMIL